MLGGSVTRVFIAYRTVPAPVAYSKDMLLLYTTLQSNWSTLSDTP